MSLRAMTSGTGFTFSCWSAALGVEPAPVPWWRTVLPFTLAALINRPPYHWGHPVFPLASSGHTLPVCGLPGQRFPEESDAIQGCTPAATLLTTGRLVGLQ